MSLPNDQAFLMRPVLAKLIRYESLIDGTLDLNDIADLHDALDVETENQLRAQLAAERQANKR